jgi:hypothetical protein
VPVAQVIQARVQVVALAELRVAILSLALLHPQAAEAVELPAQPEKTAVLAAVALILPRQAELERLRKALLVERDSSVAAQTR